MKIFRNILNKPKLLLKYWVLYSAIIGACPLNVIKVRIFFEKSIEKKHLCRHDKNYCYFCKSNIPVINLIVGSRNMIKVSKNMSL